MISFSTGAGIVLALIPVLSIFYMMWLLGHNMGSHAEETRSMAVYQRDLDNRVKYEVDKKKFYFLTEGEKIGYEKGFEAGNLNAREELRSQFIVFLEGQLELLKNRQITNSLSSLLIESKDENGLLNSKANVSRGDDGHPVKSV